MKNKPVKTEKQTGDITNVITWDEFISYGLNHFSNIVDGMPWSFDWMGFKSTHENDRLYIIEGLGDFTPTDLIVDRWNEEYSIISTQEQGDDIRDILIDFIADWYKDNPTVSKEKIIKMADNYLAKFPTCQFERSEDSTSSTICKWCGKEKWEHNQHLTEQPISELSECEHDYVYKIMFDHTACDVCTKCGHIKKQFTQLNK